MSECQDSQPPSHFILAPTRTPRRVCRPSLLRPLSASAVETVTLAAVAATALSATSFTAGPTKPLVRYSSPMSTPLDEHALDFLDDDAKRLVKEMLKAVVEHPDSYSNGFSVEPKRDGSFEYFLGGYGRPGPFINNRRLPIDIPGALVHHGIAGDKIDPQWSNNFLSFTDAALNWHRRYGGPDPDEVRRRIGRFIRSQGGRHQHSTMYEAATVAAEIGVAEQQVREQTELLVARRLVESLQMRDSDFGILALTVPEGMPWAEARFPPIRSPTSPTINVNIDLQIEIHNIIEQARAAELPEALLLEYEARLKRVQDELEKPKGKGRFQRVRELMEFAANTKAVALLTAEFVAGHADGIQGLVDVVESAIP